MIKKTPIKSLKHNSIKRFITFERGDVKYYLEDEIYDRCLVRAAAMGRKGAYVRQEGFAHCLMLAVQEYVETPKLRSKWGAAQSKGQLLPARRGNVVS